ncbi:hypothetical protein Vi05172_g8480 [Venturia inaequalis]|nr:hypothetical protein Vi05172_g8480 [Venturia inaequalis]
MSPNSLATLAATLFVKTAVAVIFVSASRPTALTARIEGISAYSSWNPFDSPACAVPAGQIPRFSVAMCASPTTAMACVAVRRERVEKTRVRNFIFEFLI